MENTSQSRGVTGDVKVVFAVPTDVGTKWRMKKGKLTYRNGAVAAIHVEEGYIPSFESPSGLTVTYFTFKTTQLEDGKLVGDVTMLTCLGGRVMDVHDIALGVEVIPLPELAAALATKAQGSAPLISTP